MNIRVNSTPKLASLPPFPALLATFESCPIALLHALAACLTAGIANIAAARNVNLTEVTSTVEGDIVKLPMVDAPLDSATRDALAGASGLIAHLWGPQGDADSQLLRAVLHAGNAALVTLTRIWKGNLLVGAQPA